jgi:hypothetical protein
MLNIFVAVDVGERLAIPRLDTLEEGDDLLLVVGHPLVTP